ncbi:MAG: hypothetical protein N3D73_01960 [Candidatus Diapherotrites archaeon]|nr:hypothetical protein [Candidatus Diapherotrites archaeon]
MRGKERKLFFLIFIVLLSTDLFSSEYVFWLRGKDTTLFVDGNYNYMLTSTPPNMSSSKTLISTMFDFQGELGKWYSLAFPSDYFIDGKICLWVKNFPKDVNLRFFIYDFYNKTVLIDSSEWGSTENGFLCSNGTRYHLNKGHSLKLVLEYKKKSIDQLDFYLDEPSLSYTKEIFKTPSNKEYFLTGVKSTAAIVFSACSLIACKSNKDCDDNNGDTEDLCVNQNSCESYCLNKQCGVKCKNDYDCNDGNTSTFDKCEFPGSCYSYCINEACNIKCKNDYDCNGGYCIYPNTCFSKCIYSQCDSVRPSDEKKCFSYICFNNIWQDRRILNCCGNGLCEVNEENCEDCSDNDFNIFLNNPKQGDYFSSGSDINLVVSIKRGNNYIENAKVKAYINNNYFNFIQNGTFYTTKFKIPSFYNGTLPILIEAVKDNHKARINFNLVIIPILKMVCNVNKEKFRADEILSLTCKSENKITDINSIVNVYCNNDIVEEKIFFSDNFVFSYSLRSLLSCKDVKIFVNSEDKFGNKYIFEKFLEIEEPVSYKDLRIVVSGLEDDLNKGENLDIKVKVYNENILVKNADVFLFFNSKNYNLDKDNNGNYFISLKIPYDIRSLEKAEIISYFSDENTNYFGRFTKNLKIADGLINIWPIEEGLSNDRVNFVFSFSYPDNIIPENPKINVLINNENKEFSLIGKNIIKLSEKCTSDCNIILNITIEDSFGNKGNFEKQYFFNQKQTRIANLLTLILFFLFILSLYIYYYKRQKLTEQKKELIKKITNLQKSYFVDGLLSKEKYYKLLNDYKAELKNLKDKLGDYSYEKDL